MAGGNMAHPLRGSSGINSQDSRQRRFGDLESFGLARSRTTLIRYLRPHRNLPGIPLRPLYRVPAIRPLRHALVPP